MIGDILGLLGGVFDGLKKRIPDQAQRDEIEKELKLAAAEIDKIREEDMSDARSLAAQETKVSFKDPRAWPRPAWAFSALVVWLVTIVKSGWEIGIHDYAIIGSVVTFYFGIRTYEKIKNGVPILGIKRWGGKKGGTG